MLYNFQKQWVHNLMEIHLLYNLIIYQYKYLNKMHVFPTLPSPTTTNFTVIGSNIDIKNIEFFI